MPNKNNDLSSIKILNMAADGMCGPDGCNIEEHRKLMEAKKNSNQVEKNKQLFKMIIL